MLPWLVLTAVASEDPAWLVPRGDIPSCRSLDPADSGDRTERVGTIRNALWLGLRTYQLVVSPADGAGCSFYPSCSAYTVRAVRAHGPILGAWLGIARIQRSHGDPEYRLCRAGGRLFHYDVPAAAAFWVRR